jgi:acyl-CoA thioester hydrolase
MNDTTTLIYRCPLTVRWGDMDAQGHVNNAVFATYFEQARTLWTAALGSPLEAAGEGMILAKTTINYRKPIVFPAELTVELHAGQAGRTSFTLPNLIRDASTGEVYADGECVIVWFDYTAQKTAALPDFMREALVRVLNAT